MAYNKAIFDKQGIKYPTKDWTITDMIALPVASPPPRASSPRSGGAGSRTSTPPSGCTAGRSTTAPSSKSVLDQPQAVEAFQFYLDQGFGSMKIAPTSNTSHRAGLNPTFGNGQWPSSTWPRR